MKTLRFPIVLLLLVLSVATAGYYAGTTHERKREEKFQFPVDDYAMRLRAAEGYVMYLEGQGYRADYAAHKAFVEVGLIPADSIYYAIEQD